MDSLYSKRTIIFGREDFAPIFQNLGMRFNSITDHEWERFYDMFLEGTHWSEIANLAASEIKYQRSLDD